MGEDLFNIQDDDEDAEVVKTSKAKKSEDQKGDAKKPKRLEGSVEDGDAVEKKRRTPRAKDQQVSVEKISQNAYQEQINMLMQDVVFMKSQFLNLQKQTENAMQQPTLQLSQQSNSQMEITRLMNQCSIITSKYDLYRGKLEKIVLGLTFHKIIERVKKMFGWERYDITDFNNSKSKNNRIGCDKIIEDTINNNPSVDQPKMRRWAKLFNRYARDGEPSHNEEIEMVVGILMDEISRADS